MYHKVKGLDVALNGITPGDYRSRRLIQEPEEVTRTKRKLRVKFEQLEMNMNHVTVDPDKLSQVSLVEYVETPNERNNANSQHTNHTGRDDMEGNKTREQFLNIKEANIVPVENEEGNSVDWNMSKDEMERIAAMFCIETPEQAFIRRSKADNNTSKIWRLSVTPIQDLTVKEDIKEINLSSSVGDGMEESNGRKQDPEKDFHEGVKVHLRDTTEEDIELMTRSKEDLARIVAMFCVKTPEQAQKRWLQNNQNEEDGSGFFRPGIGNCDFPVSKIITYMQVGNIYADHVSDNIFITDKEKEMSNDIDKYEKGQKTRKKGIWNRIITFFRNIFRRNKK